MRHIINNNTLKLAAAALIYINYDIQEKSRERQWWQVFYFQDGR